MAWTGREWLVATLAVFGFWAVAAAIWPLTGTVVPWDSKNQFYPFLRFLSDSLAGGEVPLWNPYHFSGHPTSADPQSLLFTPTMLFFAWAVPKPSMQLFDAVVLAHLLPGALGMLGLFSRRGWHPAGGVLAAAIFILGGSASARLQHTGIILGYGFYPLALFLLEEMLDRRSWRFALGFALTAVLMTIGRDQVAFLAGISLIGFVIYRAVQSGTPIRYLTQRLGQLALAGLVGGALLAVPSLLTMQFLMTSTRPSFGYGVAAMGSLPPESFSTILFADIFGSLRWTYDYWGPDWHSLSEGSWTDRSINYLFVGTIPALLILMHGIAGTRLLAREFRFFLWLGVASSIYALGRYTPIFGLIFDHLPGVDLYRRPADATFIINVVLAFASGYLVHRYIRDGVPHLSRISDNSLKAILTALAICLAVAAVLSGLDFAIRAKQSLAAIREVLLGCTIAGLAGWVLLRASPGRRSRIIAAVFLVAATCGELVWRNAASSLNAEPAERYAALDDKLPPEQKEGLAILKREIAERHAKGERPRVEILGLGQGWQNASMMLGLEDTIGYNPLRLAEYERAIGPGENAVDPNLRQFPGTFRGYRCRLAKLLGLEYLVLDRPIERLPKHFPRPSGSTLLYGAGSMWIYRLNSGAPRAYLATHLLPVDSEAVLEENELPEFDTHSQALVEREDVASLKGDYGLHDGATAPDPAIGSVKVATYDRNAVTLDVDTDRNSLVVLHDIRYPGWEAMVDGKVQPILRVNLLFRGVEVGPGQHKVTFRFRPLSVGNLAAATKAVLAHEHGEAEKP